MFLLPILVLAVVGWAIYKMVHRPSPSVIHAGGAPVAGTVRHHAFWPTTAMGWVGIAAFGVLVLVQVAVNAIQVPFLTWGLAVAALALTAGARFGTRDRSPAVLIVLIVTAIATIAAVLFLAGEILVG